MSKPLSIILGCDPLLGPMTGIGHYTKQLGLALKQSKDVRDLKLFAHSAFFNDKLLQERSLSDSEEPSRTMLASLRSRLGGNKLAVAAYQKLVPHLARHRLRPYESTHILHSPNFILPPFNGRRVVTFHDLSPVILPQYHPSVRANLVSREMQKVIEGDAHIITDTEFVKKQVISYYGISNERVSSIALAASRAFYPRTQFECQQTLLKNGLEHNNYFLFVSTIEPRKNLRRLLKAHEQYWQRARKPFPLVLVGGEGWNSEKEHEEIKRLEALGIVKYLGYAAQEDMYKLYAGARALLFASEYEGFGLPVLEAMQSGTAVLTSRNSSMSEVCGNAALLCDYSDVDEISRNITKICEDDELRYSLERDGITRASQFSWEKCAESTIDVYRTLSNNT